MLFNADSLLFRIIYCFIYKYSAGLDGTAFAHRVHVSRASTVYACQQLIQHALGLDSPNVELREAVPAGWAADGKATPIGDVVAVTDLTRANGAATAGRPSRVAVRCSVDDDGTLDVLTRAETCEALKMLLTWS